MRSLFSSHHVMNSPHFSLRKFTTSSTTGRTVALILSQASIIDCLNASFSFHSLMKTQTSPTSAATNMLIGLAKSTPHNKPTTLNTLPTINITPINACLRLHRKVITVTTIPMNSMKPRSEEHTSELQSRFDLVCRLL